MTGHALDISISPDKSSALYVADYPVVLPDDKPWGGQARVDAHDKGPQRAWLEQFRDRGPFVLVDVGANVGLFSRQALIALPNISHVFAYEPDIRSWGTARLNLEPWADKISVYNFALGEAAGTRTLFREKTNSGNYSFLRSAMAEFENDAVTVQVRDIAAEVPYWLWHGQPILYKSDTQGYDEALASLLPLEFWRSHVFAALFEVWRITKPAAPGFGRVLGQFKHHRLLNVWNGEGKPPGCDVTVDGACKWMAAPNDYVGEDLAAWR